MSGETANSFRCEVCIRTKDNPPAYRATIKACHECLHDSCVRLAHGKAHNPHPGHSQATTISELAADLPPMYANFIRGRFYENGTARRDRLYCKSVKEDGTVCGKFLGTKTSPTRIATCWYCNTKTCICDEPPDNLETHVCQPPAEDLVYPPAERGKSWQRCPNERCKTALHWEAHFDDQTIAICPCCPLRGWLTKFHFTSGEEVERRTLRINKKRLNPEKSEKMDQKCSVDSASHLGHQTEVLNGVPQLLDDDIGNIAVSKLDQSPLIRQASRKVMHNQVPEAAAENDSGADVKLHDDMQVSVKPDDEIAAMDYLASFERILPSEPMLLSDAQEPVKETDPVDSLVFEQEFLRISTAFEAGIHPENMSPNDQTPDATIHPAESKTSPEGSITAHDAQEMQVPGSSSFKTFVMNFFWIMAILFAIAVLGLVACVSYFHSMLLLEAL